MFCPRCGNESPDGMLFCDKCGNPLPVVPKPPVNSDMMYGNQVTDSQNLGVSQNITGASNGMGAQSFTGNSDFIRTQNVMNNQTYGASNSKQEKRKKEKTPKTGKKKVKIFFLFILFIVFLVGGMYLGIKLMDSNIIDLSFLGVTGNKNNMSNIPGIMNANIENTITYKGYQLVPEFDYDITHQNDKLYLNIDGTIILIDYHSDVAYDDMVKKANSLKTDMQKTMGNNYYVGDPTTLYKNEKQYIEMMIYDVAWKPFSKVFYTGERGGKGVWIVSVAPVDYDKYEDVLEMVIEAKKSSKVYSTYANELVLPNISVLGQSEISEVLDVLSGDITESVSGDSGESFSGNQESLSE